jgi:hypothetical protein
MNAATIRVLFLPCGDNPASIAGLQAERCAPSVPLPFRVGNPYFFCNESDMDNSKTVDHPDRKTVAVRQGTGPRATVSVLLISLLMAAAVGVVFLVYFYWVR